MAIQRGNLVTLQIHSSQGSEASVTLETEHTFSKSTNMLEGTAKSSGNHSVFSPGTKSYTISFSFLFDPAGAVNYDTLFGYENANTLIYWKITDGVTGNEEQSGSGYISGLDKTAAYGDLMNGSGTIQGTGAVTTATIA